MRKFLKVTFVIIAALLIIVSVLAAYVSFVLPTVGDAPNLKIELTLQRVERGKYLATSVAACMACHSERDFRFFAGPPVPESLGAGGEKFGREIGFPGNVYSTNITSYALQSWTDGEIPLCNIHFI